MSILEFERKERRWLCGFCEEKLLLRGHLPGAYGYDQSAASFREARQQGVTLEALLPPALPNSWMVNNKAASPVFQQWLQPPLRETWARLCESLSLEPAAWLAQDDEARTSVQQDVEALCIAGQGVAALSKVLAALCPQLVPLMDDAALWFALDAIEYPKDADHPRAGAALFLPMLDWFATQVETHKDHLRTLAQGYTFAPLGPAQVLDRLLWFESWGFHILHGQLQWRWVRDAQRESIIPVAPLSRTEYPPAACLPLEDVDDPHWRDECSEILQEIYEEADANT